jgi:hypothetical protein
VIECIYRAHTNYCVARCSEAHDTPNHGLLAIGHVITVIATAVFLTATAYHGFNDSHSELSHERSSKAPEKGQHQRQCAGADRIWVP